MYVHRSKVIAVKQLVCVSFKLIYVVFVTSNFVFVKKFLANRIIIVKLSNLKSCKSITHQTVTQELNTINISTKQNKRFDHLKNVNNSKL